MKKYLQPLSVRTLAVTCATMALTGTTGCHHDNIVDEEETKEVIVDPASCTGGDPLAGTCTMTFNGVTFKMIRVPGGTFAMGCQAVDPSAANYDEVATEYEMPVHTVTLSTYAIGETEVTQGLWEAVTGETPTNGAKQWSKKRGLGANYPAYHVSFYDICNRFLPKLNSAGLLPEGYEFALPTEAQWEFAAQGGEQPEYLRFAGSNTIDDVAWWYVNGDQTTHEVKTKQPNALGIYDMTGNLWEWNLDFYDYCAAEAQTDPQGPTEGVDHVIRGGSYDTGDGRSVIHARVYSDYPASRNEYLGFRIVANKKK